jgi:hypothetical protein
MQESQSPTRLLDQTRTPPRLLDQQTHNQDDDLLRASKSRDFEKDLDR